MKFSQCERETWTKPAAVGPALRVFIVVCNIPFNSEYNALAFSDWATLDNAMLDFSVVFPCRLPHLVSFSC